MVDPEDDALDVARRAHEQGARLIEWRIDRVTDTPELIEELVRESPVPCIVTCRPTWEGGDYDGNDQDRISLIERIALNDDRPHYVDLEAAAYFRSANLRQKANLVVQHPGQTRENASRLILSVHDFKGRPDTLYQRLESMASEEACAVVKIAWFARSIRDNLEAFELVRTRSKPMIALCMGEFGVPSRILAPKFGSLLTFAPVDVDFGTAPGQIPLHELRETYRFDSINADTRVYGVVGWPVGHSQSPRVHNRIFDATGFNGVYVPLPVAPEYEPFKASVLSWLDYEPLTFRGASVTLPHKQNLVRLAREEGWDIDPMVDDVGAANTLAVTDAGRVSISNTDVAALVDSITMMLETDDLRDRRAAVIGAGGVARAAVAGLSARGATVVIYNRTFEHAETLAAAFHGKPDVHGGARHVVAARIEKICDTCCDIFVNATPVGMEGGPAPDESPIPADVGSTPKWGPETLVMDTVYQPVNTPLIEAAARDGCRVVDGLDMFIRQAARQSQIWTGRAPDHAQMRKSLAPSIR